MVHCSRCLVYGLLDPRQKVMVGGPGRGNLLNSWQPGVTELSGGAGEGDTTVIFKECKIYTEKTHGSYSSHTRMEITRKFLL